MVVQLTFDFRGPIAKINISKERQDYGDRSGPRILEIDSVILKLSRFPQVQSEREWTLVGVRPQEFFHFVMSLLDYYVSLPTNTFHMGEIVQVN